MNAAPPFAPSAPHRAHPGKYLTFFLDTEEYGIDVLAVREIVGLLPITRVPGMPSFVRGVVNLRGKVIPILDLRERFGMPSVVTREQCIIVVHARDEPLGMLVDRVAEVVGVGAAELEPIPALGSGVRTEFLLAIAPVAGRVRLLLDVERVLTLQEIAGLGPAADLARVP